MIPLLFSDARIAGTRCIVSWRKLSTACTLCSGHNRWSKIKHDKGKIDAHKNRERSFLAKGIAHASKVYGPDPATNGRLATLIASAKKAGFPKSSIQTAIDRGRGISASGSALENMVVEFMVPPSIAAIVECQTDSRARTLQDIRDALKSYGGTMTPTAYMFERKGKLVYENKDSASEEQVLDSALDAGAQDVEYGDDGTFALYTEPNEITAVAEAFNAVTKGTPQTQELIWTPKDDSKVEVDSDSMADNLSKLVARLEDDSSVQDIYLNTV